MDIFVQASNILAEIMARRGKGRALKTTMLHHLQIIPNVVFSWAGKKGGIVRKHGIWPCHQRLHQGVSGSHRLFRGELCRSESKQSRHHGKCGEVSRRHKDQHFLPRQRVGQSLSVTKLAQVKMHFGVTLRSQQSLTCGRLPHEGRTRLHLSCRNSVFCTEGKQAQSNSLGSQ